MRSYQKIAGIHRPEVVGVLDDHVIIEEKIDGSQFRIEIDGDGNISCGSHHQELNMVDNNFKLGCDQAVKTFHGVREPDKIITIFSEYLAKPKQNQIPYSRVPKNNFIIFDVKIGDKMLDREEKERFAFNYGCEVVPLLWRGHGSEFTDEVREKLLKTKSILGHQKGYDRIEGIVIKAYDRKFNFDEGHSLAGHFMCTKIVNDSFKETKKIKSPKGDNKLEGILESVRSVPRWNKAVQTLTELGELNGEMKDIGLITRRVMTDLQEEEEETIKNELYKLFGKDILKASVQGLSTWYQNKLEANDKV